MARLGRGRRSTARITHNVSAPTPTPLVRNRVKQTPNGARRAWRVVFRRRRAHIVLRAPQPTLASRAKQPLVSRADVRAASRTRGFQPRGARIIRNVSTPTATPLVRNRVKQTPNGVRRAWRVAVVFRRKRAHIMLRAPQPGAPLQKPRQPLVSRADIRAIVRARGYQPRGARITRNVSSPTATPLVKPTVIRAGQPKRAARVRAFFVRHPAQLVRPPIVAPVATRQRQPLVTQTKAAIRARYTKPRGATQLRSHVYTIQTKTVPTLVLGRNNRKAALARSYYLRHRTHLETSTLGSATPQVTIVTTFFGPPLPADAGLGGVLGESELGGVLDERELVGAVGGNEFGTPNPRRT